MGLFFGLLYIIIVYKTYYFVHTPLTQSLVFYSIFTGAFLLSRLIIAFYYEDNHKRKHSPKKYPRVSFVIACKNEEDSIRKTIAACMRSDYPGVMECVAVNDGSTDKTLLEMRKAKRDFPGKVKIINFEKNRGKREGMAEGVKASKNEIIIFVDSDSFLASDAAKHIVEHFMEDPKIGAISGNTMVENKDVNTLTKMQSARYGVSYDIFKSCESVFGTVTCCPGCFSAYRKSSILKVMDRWLNQTFLGTRSTFGDDRSLTNYVMRTEKVIYCRKAVATTIVPEKYPQFFKQQLRWKKSWIREGANTGSFIWKKHPIASISYYTNLFIPILGPIVVGKMLIVDVLMRGEMPFYFVGGVLVMSILFGIYYYLIYQNRYWWYVTIFTLLYTFVLVWQMPYAVLKVRDTKWGTR